ncbi:MAG: DUF2125 domain-containing protein [Rhodospirillales bacterium]
MTAHKNSEPELLIVETPFADRRRRRVTLFVVLIGAMALYTGWWFWLAGAVRDHIDGWIAAEKSEGRSVSYGALAISGYPGRLIIEVTDAKGVDPLGGWHLNVPSLQAALAPWNIGSLDGNLKAPVTLNLGKGAFSGRYTFSAGRNALYLDRSGGGKLTLTLEAAQVIDEANGEAMALASLSAVLTRGSVPVYADLDLDIRTIDLPPRFNSPFGPNIAHLKTRLQLTGAEPPAGPDADALRGWTRDGGALDIKRLDLAHGVLGLAGEGTLALDADLQPIGAFTARITGFEPAIEQLVRAGMVRPEDGALARVVLGVLARVPNGGGPKQLSLPLGLQDRQLTVGPLKLIRLPLIVWE